MKANGFKHRVKFTKRTKQNEFLESDFTQDLLLKKFMQVVKI